MITPELMDNHRQWLHHPHTQLILGILKKKREGILSTAENKASFNAVEESQLALIKSKAHKEIYELLQKPESLFGS